MGGHVMVGSAVVLGCSAQDRRGLQASSSPRNICNALFFLVFIISLRWTFGSVSLFR